MCQDEARLGLRSIAVSFFKEGSTGRLLVLSQVVFSLQLSFAVVPLVMFTSDCCLMDEFVYPLWLKILAWTVAIVIAGLNIWLLVQTLGGWLYSL